MASDYALPAPGILKDILLLVERYTSAVSIHLDSAVWAWIQDIGLYAGNLPYMIGPDSACDCSSSGLHDALSWRMAIG